MIRWMHLSDLHIQNHADWNNFSKELLIKCKDIGKIDFVIVTGDFHNFSEGNNFEQAKLFLEKLAVELCLDIKTDLFLIPGNHDGVTHIEEKQIYINAAKHNPLDLCQQQLERLLQMFVDYENFVKELIPGYPAEHPAMVHNRKWNNKINFIHCNTAIGADGGNKHYELLDIDGLAEADYSVTCPNIILAHHNFKDLHEALQNRVKDVIRVNSVRAYLCGDRHQPEIDMIKYQEGQNREIPCVGCYKSSTDSNDEYSKIGMIVAEWKDKSVQLKGWYWESGMGFKPDEEITEKTIDMGGMEGKGETETASGGHGTKKKEGKEDTVTVSDNWDTGNEQVVVLPLDKKEESYRQRKEFIQRFYNLTPRQVKQLNQKYGNEFGELSHDNKTKSFCQYLMKAEEKSKLKEILDYLKSL